ncbi:MAG: cysteine synthase family protein [Armatimonadetes bacterium]|nr:cysteine synthase family protein [Armatimonadota bacterium]
MSDTEALAVLDRVGNTPLVELEGVFVKLECVNPCGSVKDRIAAYILTKAHESGRLEPGQPIVEATSGNTGIALAFYGRLLGHPVTIVMPEHMTDERKDLIRGFGADLVLCSKEGSFAEAAAIRDRIAAETGAYSSDQFANPLNTECHRETTGREIVRQMPTDFARPAAFVAGVGTGGTLIGVGQALLAAWGEVTVVAVEPLEAAVMTGGENGPHGIFGIGDGFVPDIAADGSGGLNAMIDSVEVVSTEEATEEAKRLASEHSLCVGVSSGANFLAAQRLKERHATVVTVFADGHQKYHSVGLAASEGACPYRHVCAQGEIERLQSQST